MNNKIQKLHINKYTDNQFYCQTVRTVNSFIIDLYKKNTNCFFFLFVGIIKKLLLQNFRLLELLRIDTKKKNDQNPPNRKDIFCL